MIIIDDNADLRLADAVRSLRLSPSSARCIYLNLQGKAVDGRLKETVIASIAQHVTDNDAQIYFCEDGDICVLSPTLPVKQGNRFILDMVDYFRIPAEESWVSFNDATVMLSALSLAVEAKLEKHRKAEEAKRKILQQQQQERKRQSILGQPTIADVTTINARREQREQPELMIIEDDVFSCKLVENVLQKKFSITILKEATHALEDYARIAPDLLFLDINLPDVTGHELLEHILGMDADAHVIMLSGNADQMNIMQAMKKGAKGFIAKPFTREKLFQYIDRCPGIIQKLSVHG